MPSPMYRAHVDCQGCHHPARVGVEAEGMSVVEASCRACHAGRYEDRLAQWREASSSLAAEIDQLIAQARTEIADWNGSDAERLSSRIDDAAHNVTLVRRGRAAHNFNYATALLNGAKATVQEVLQVMKGE